MTVSVSNGSKVLPILVNTGATLLVTTLLLGFVLFSNSLNFTQHVAITLSGGAFVLGLVCFAKTQVDGVLLMTGLLGRCDNEVHVAAVIGGLTLTNGIATFGMDGLYVLVNAIVWLTLSIILFASSFLLELGYQGYKDLSVDEDHDGVADNEERTDSFKGKSVLQIAAISFALLIVLYGDGTAANLELLTPENFLSLTLAQVFGQFVLGICAALIPRQQFAAIAKNHTFHVVGIIAFIGLAGLGYFEGTEGFIEHYGMQNGLIFVTINLAMYKPIMFAFGKLVSAIATLWSSVFGKSEVAAE
jgi:hypothetical protein